MLAKLRQLWSRWFGKKVQKPGFSIPAPQTLVGRIEKLDDQDRDLVRVAEEALRRGFPEQAVIAYRKAVKVYVDKELHTKALSILIALLRLAPQDEEAWLQRAKSCEALSRRSDAARAFFQAGALAEARGDRPQALERYEQAIELDFRTSGLQQRYVALGGTRDAWSRDLPPDAILEPASAVILTDTSDGVLEPPGDRTSMEEAVDLDLGLPVEAAPVEKAIIAKVRPLRFSIPNQSTTYDQGLPSSLIGSEHQRVAESSEDLEALDPTEDSDPLDDSDDGIAVPDAPTEAYDVTALAGLLARAKQQ